MEQKSGIEIRNNRFDPVGNIKLYVEKNPVPLFKTLSNNPLTAVFDEKGFFFSSAAEAKYNLIKSEPHLYIAFTKDNIGTTYIGKSFQKGGRWKRNHYYHLGTLAHHLQNSIIKGDQNHSHWIDAWMNVNSIKRVGNTNTVNLKSEVLVVFIPFEIYSKKSRRSLLDEDIIKINDDTEGKLIKYFSSQNVGLLNIHKNKNRNRTQPSSEIKKTLTQIPPKPPKKNTANINNNVCIEFRVTQDQSIANVAGTIRNLPVGPCTIEIINPENGQNLYVQNNGTLFRTIRTRLRTVREYFEAIDGRGPYKWRVVQNEMIDNGVQEIIVIVCPN